MKTQRILIVDDQVEVRRVLRLGLETLNKNFEIVDVPSGEEAMLVITRQPLDILVSDVRLPGISGLELKSWAKIRNPNLKLILVTGLVDPQVREEVMHAGADAFFFKPVEISEFLKAIERCLGPVEPETAPREVQPAEQGLAERLSSLRRESGLAAVILLDDRGRTLVRAGELHDLSAEMDLAPALMAFRSAGGKLAHTLGEMSAQNLMVFVGPQSNIYLADAGPLLLAGWEVPLRGEDPVDRVLAALRPAVQDLAEILSRMGVPAPAAEPVQVQPAIDQAAGPAPDLEEVFQQQKQPGPEEAGAFWDALAGESEASLLNADVLSFEQARRLGLAPKTE